MTPKTIGPWNVLALLGQGGMGRVYRAEPLEGGPAVALKVLQGSISDAAVLQRFEREEQVLAELDHPGIVRPLSPLVCEGERAYYAMELVEGGDLGDEIRAEGGLTPARAIEVGVGVLEALGAAHAQGVVHRDVKPSNLLLDADGRPRLADFGLASVASASGLTRTGTVLGTPEYMSPEQADGESADARSDLYAVGILLYEALSGRAPFRAEKPLALLRQHLVEPVPPLVSRHPLPAGLEGVIRRALEKDPAARWQDAASMAAALRDVAGNPPAPSPAATADTVVLGAKRETVTSVGQAGQGPEASAEPAASRGVVVWLLLAGALGLGLAWIGTRPNPETAGEEPSPPAAVTSEAPAAAPPGRRVVVQLAGGGVVRGHLLELDLGANQAVVRDDEGLVQRLDMDAIDELNYPEE